MMSYAALSEMRVVRRLSRGPIPGAALLILFLLGSPLAGCGRGSGEDPDTDADTTAAVVIPVAVHVLENGDAAARIRTWGTVRPAREADILAEVSGQVGAVHAGLGDRVRKDEVLVEIDPQLFSARLREAESRAESARLALERIRRELERSEALYEKGTISDSEVEVSRTAAAEYEAASDAATGALEQARKNLAAARVRAPFDGHMASRPPDVGSTVGLGAPLATVVDIDHVRVEARVSEMDLPRIHRGGTVEVATEGVPGRMYHGTLSAVGPQADAATRQFPVEVTVDNRPDHLLKGGMVARVQIVTETLTGRPLLPVDALVETDRGMACFVIVDGVAHEVLPELGPREGNRAAVLGGLAAGDSVAVLGQNRLAEDTPVRVEEVR